MNNNRYKILVIEDESNIRSFAKAILEANNYQALVASTCQQGIMMVSCHIPDVIILDLGLPDRDGLELIRSVRQNLSTPIIVLSARTLEQDKVTALDLGANDYVTKPFGTAELLARVRAALRSRRPISNGSAQFHLNNMVIDYDRRTVCIDGDEIKFTQTEYNILAYLSEHTGKVLTYSAIISAVWGHIDDGSIKKLQVNMANIRKKLGEKPGENKYIVNELSVGYRMINEEN